ncbi:hypothetical protein P4S72_15370 [Vibrio sp. PP-XX7]
MNPGKEEKLERCRLNSEHMVTTGLKNTAPPMPLKPRPSRGGPKTIPRKLDVCP